MTVPYYPIVGASSGPAAQHKLRYPHFFLAVGILLGVLVIVVTAVVVLIRPTPTLCHFTCGPDMGPRLLSPTAYRSSQFGYQVEYDSGYFSERSPTVDGVELDLANGRALLQFAAERGSDVDGAIQRTLSGLPTNKFENLQQIGSVPGAEIGLVQGIGVAYSADFVPPNGGQSFPVSIAVMASTLNNLTISVLAISDQDVSSVAYLPLGFEFGQPLDGPVTNTLWPGRQ